MQVFITGGTGLIGSAVVAELLGAGHTVLALTRSDTSAAAAQRAGADDAPRRSPRPRRDPRRRRAVRRRDPPRVQQRLLQPGGARRLDRRGDGGDHGDRRGVRRQRPPVRDRVRHTVDPGPRLHRDTTRSRPTGPSAAVAARSTATLALADRGVRTSAIRMPRTVHNNGTGGFAGLLTRSPDAPASPATPVTAPSGGPPSTRSTPPSCSAWRSSTLRPAAPGTPSPTRATPSATSPPSSAGSSACRPSRCPRNRSVPSARSSRWTNPPPARSPAPSSAGRRRT